MTQKECEAKGWIWNKKKQTCTQPKISTIKLAIPRGPGCDGTEKRATKGSKLKKSTILDLLKATAKKKKSKSRPRRGSQ